MKRWLVPRINLLGTTQNFALNGIIPGCSTMSTKAEVSELFRAFGINEDCTLEQLRQAHARALERNMGNADRMEELDKQYMKLTFYIQGKSKTTGRSLFTHSRRSGFGSGKEIKRSVDADYAASDYRRKNTEYDVGDTVTEGSIPGVASDFIKDKIIGRALDKADLSTIKGFGKPLPKVRYENPYVDNMQNKLNTILINQNYSTEWIELQKQVKTDITRARAALTRCRERLLKENKSTSFETPSKEWSTSLSEFYSDIDVINKKIDDINLSVPSLRLQQAQLSKEREIEKLEEQWGVPSDQRKKSKLHTAFTKAPPAVRYDHPYVDDIETKLNNILLKENCATDWIELQKQIKEDIAEARKVVTLCRERLLKEGKSVRFKEPSTEWKLGIEKFYEDIGKINKKIDDLNLQVPTLWLQQAHYNKDREIAKLEKDWRKTE